MKKIILASTSPRRKELLKQLVEDYQIITKNGKEITDKTIPCEMVMELAAHKALPVLNEQDGDCVVIGADTIVVLDGDILGKPRDKADAIKMLGRLSDREHKVFTGVCLASKTRVDLFYVESGVIFYKLGDEQIRAYVDTGSPLDKAGAYGIQDSGFVKEIIGSYTNVMGLPLEELGKHLKKFTEE